MLTAIRRFRIQLRRPLLVMLLSGALVLPGPVAGQQPSITPNYKDADIRQVIEAVSEITGKNFVLDPRVKAQVTMLSSVPMTPDAFYEAFLSILSVYGFVAVPSGNVIKILPDANARQVPGSEMSPESGRRADDIVTQVIQVRNVAAAQLVPILRPLIPQYGHLAAYPASNMLIISDRAANVDRMLRIIRRIDQAGDEDFEVIRLEFASAAEIVRIVNALAQGAAAGGQGAAGPQTTVVADDRTNSILISGDKNERLRIRTLITHLDTPLETGGNTQVRYLRYADAEELAAKLQTQYTQQGADPTNQSEAGEVIIWADVPTNALIVTAPPKTMASMMTVVDKLDIRRLQVLLETIIVEVMAERAADLGVTWAVWDGKLENAVGLTDFSNVTGVKGLASIIDGDDAAAGEAIAGLGSGITMGLGRLSDSGTNFVALIEALEADTDTNVMGTPILVTLDNEEAEIKVGQEVPFVTGSFTNTGTGGGGAVNPFQTVQREQVGLTLTLTPQINEGDAVRLKIAQEISTVSDSVQAVDLITNNRTIDTAVIVEDKGVLVIGGLIQDEMREKVERVPLLGSIPLVGTLFRSTSRNKIKTNLMFFIRPTILRDDVQAAFETNAKYTFIRNLQLDREPDRVLPTWEAKRPAPPVLPWSPEVEGTTDDGTPTIDLRNLGSGEDVPPPPEREE
ncbi:MAG: type II secretion system secretin GspD [Gammaproteobacteria bacterium]|nr:type II secretion system secretin GspD [Gammaproteobacteria bacterium]